MGIIISDYLDPDDIIFDEKDILFGYLQLNSKQNINIFLDDIRLAPDRYDFTFKTGEDLLAFLTDTLSEVTGAGIDTLSLDHDLGEGVMDGYAFVKAFVDLGIPVRRIQLHTDNMVGFKNMYLYLVNAQKHGLLASDVDIEPRKVSVVDGVETVMYRPL